MKDLILQMEKLLEREKQALQNYTNWQEQDKSLDFSKMIKEKKETVQRLQNGINALKDAPNVTERN